MLNYLSHFIKKNYTARRNQILKINWHSGQLYKKSKGFRKKSWSDHIFFRETINLMEIHRYSRSHRLRNKNTEHFMRITSCTSASTNFLHTHNKTVGQAPTSIATRDMNMTLTN